MVCNSRLKSVARRCSRRKAPRIRHLALFTAFALVACGPIRPPEPSSDHIGVEPPAPLRAEEIPAPVTASPDLPEPSQADALETFTVVVSDVPVRELLFALARDADMNLDIDNDIPGNITLNAIDQTLPQIMARISRLSNVRYEIEGEVLIVVQDKPFLRNYPVDYVSISRHRRAELSVSTRVASSKSVSEEEGSQQGTKAENDSTSKLTVSSRNNFWSTLYVNIAAIVGEDVPAAREVVEAPNSWLGERHCQSRNRHHRGSRDGRAT